MELSPSTHFDIIGWDESELGWQTFYTSLWRHDDVIKSSVLIDFRLKYDIYDYLNMFSDSQITLAHETDELIIDIG